MVGRDPVNTAVAPAPTWGPVRRSWTPPLDPPAGSPPYCTNYRDVTLRVGVPHPPLSTQLQHMLAHNPPSGQSCVLGPIYPFSVIPKCTPAINAPAKTTARCTTYFVPVGQHIFTYALQVQHGILCLLVGYTHNLKKCETSRV